MRRVTCSDFGLTNCCPDCERTISVLPPLERLRAEPVPPASKRAIGDILFGVAAFVCCKHVHEVLRLSREDWEKFRPIKLSKEIQSAVTELSELGIDSSKLLELASRRK